jgi:predicted nucleic acid-binding protein
MTASAGSSRALFVAEPPAAWCLRPPTVVDCSVLAALLWAEPAAGDAAALLAGKALHAPALLSYELANVARSKCRSGVPAEAARAGLQALADQRVVLHDTPALDNFDLAQSLGLSAYDAAYVWLAAALKAPLVTFDQRLAEAAQRHLGGLE